MIRQHKLMATGASIPGQGSNFGVDSFGSVNGGHASPDRDAKHTPLADGDRSGPPAIGRGAGRMRASANPDHGPHGGGSRLPR